MTDVIIPTYGSVEYYEHYLRPHRASSFGYLLALDLIGNVMETTVNIPDAQRIAQVRNVLAAATRTIEGMRT